MTFEALRKTVLMGHLGAGSVMLMDMAYGGTLGDSLFTNACIVSRDW